jgi:hypothetical protein
MPSIVDGGLCALSLFRLRDSLFTPTLMALTTSYAKDSHRLSPVGYR